MADDRLSFQEMCARYDVTPRTLRYYEYIELLNPDREGRARFYGPREIARMTLIMRGRRFGFSLEQIRQWLLLREEKGEEIQFTTFVEYANLQILELEKQRNEIEDTLNELRALRDETLGLLTDLEDSPVTADS